MPTHRHIFHVSYLDGTYGQCMAEDVDDALEQLCRSDAEMAIGPMEGPPPAGVTVSLSNV